MLIIVSTRPISFPSPNLAPLLKEADLGCSLSQLSNTGWPQNIEPINCLPAYNVAQRKLSAFRGNGYS